MDTILALWDWAAGKKTYAICLVGGVLVIAKGVFGIDIPGVAVDQNTWLQDAMSIAGGASLRHAIRQAT